MGKRRSKSDVLRFEKNSRPGGPFLFRFSVSTCRIVFLIFIVLNDFSEKRKKKIKFRISVFRNGNNKKGREKKATRSGWKRKRKIYEVVIASVEKERKKRKGKPGKDGRGTGEKKTVST